MSKKQSQKNLEDLSRKQARNILWKKGILKYKLTDLQKKIYEQFYDGEDNITTMLIARQTGKSYLLSLLATETCLRKPDAVVKFVTPKLKMVKNILNKNMKVILKDCPPHLRPEWIENEKVWRFPNGSEIQAAGSDNQNYDNIRGGTCDLWIVDEAGFCNDLEEVVFSVLIPTTTMTKGRGLLSSTPDPKQPEHDFIKLFVEPADIAGRLFKYTIHDNTRLSAAEKQEIINRYPDGENNPRFRAEYLCEIIRDSDSMVLGEFDDLAASEIVRDNFLIPKFFDYYLSMDIGGKDWTVVLLAYYDFINAQVVVLDEVVIKNKPNTKRIAKEVKDFMQEHFGEKPPYLMFADNNNVILLNDLQLDHGLNFIPTRKDNKEAAINKVKLKILDRDIIIHPRCKTLIGHMKNATWNPNTKRGYREFSKSADNGHYDAVDALIYLVRNIVESKNPYPKHYGALSPSNHYIRSKNENKDASSFNKLFKVKKSIKG